MFFSFSLLVCLRHDLLPGIREREHPSLPVWLR